MEDNRQHLRYAIIGGGGLIAQTHIEALARLGAPIVGLSDTKREQMETRGKTIGCPVFADHREMLKATQPDVAVICAPHPFHVPIGLDCFAAGVHVLTEKPISTEVAEADKLIAAAEAAHRVLAVSFQHRIRPSVEYVKHFIEAGELGDVVRVMVVEPWLRNAAYYRSAPWRGKWSTEGGGVLMNQSPHTLDLMCYLVGSPHSVWGWVRTRYQEMECEDTAQAMLEYTNGAPGYFTASTAEVGGQRRIEINGERASVLMIGDQVTIQRFKPPLREFIEHNPTLFSSPDITTETLELAADDTQGNHYAVYRDLETAIAEGKSPRCDGKQALMSLELANAITLSSYTQKPVTLPVDRVAYHQLLVSRQEKERQQ